MLRLEYIKFDVAKAACEKWHYSKTCPSAKVVRFGVWEHGKFIGAVIFGVGATRTLVRPYGLKPWQGCELVRVALGDHTAPVSKIVAIALRKLKKRYPGIELVISFADPAEGHVGRIYQAMNWTYLGTTAPERFPIINGKLTHPRTLSDHIKRGTIKSRKDVVYESRPGKHRYGYAFSNRAKRTIEKMAKPYPRAAEVSDGMTSAQRQCDSDPVAPNPMNDWNPDGNVHPQNKGSTKHERYKPWKR